MSSTTIPREKLRIAVISDVIAERNGVGTYYRDLVAHLEPVVERVELICPPQVPVIWSDHIKFPMPGDSTQHLGIPPMRQLDKQFRELKPHVVVVATPGPYGQYGLRLARREKAALIVGFHTYIEGLTKLYWHKAYGLITSWSVKKVNQRQFKKAHMVLAHSRRMVKIAGQMGAKKVELIETPLSPDFIHAPLAPLDIHIRRALFAGRLAAEKNICDVISAAEELPDIQFRIAGDGPLRETVEAAAARLPNLTYLGWLERGGMRQAFDDIDVLILPSQFESFGTVAFEAMARSRLVLVSSQCGITQWPTLKDALFTFDKDGSVASALTAMRALDQDEKQQKAHKAREAALIVHQQSLDRWFEVFQDVIKLAKK